jgi:hypothetical protein
LLFELENFAAFGSEPPGGTRNERHHRCKLRYMIVKGDRPLENHWQESIPYLPFLQMMVIWLFETI